MPEGERLANELHIDVKVSANIAKINFSIDDQKNRSIIITFPADISIYSELAESLFATWGSIFLGQLCLASKIVIHSKAFDDIDTLSPIIKNLYEIRAFRDKLPFRSLPEFTFEKSVPAFNMNLPENNLACLLFSGGIDSTLAILLLQSNGYNVLPVHVRINEGAVTGENQAVINIASTLGLDLSIVDYFFEDYLEMSKIYSKVIDVYPLENSVPHGRELILIPIAILTCLLRGAKYICLGHEHNAWTRQIEYLGQKIYRCDTQSEPANVAMQEFIRLNISKDAILFSPIAPLSDYKKFELLAKHRPDLLAATLSCYWGDWCGLCHKCSLTYVLQILFDINLIEFHNDPLSSNQYLRKIVYEWDNRTLTNWAEHHYALLRIVKNKHYDDHSLFSYYQENVAVHMRGHSQLLEESLNKIYDVKLLPNNFEIAV